MSQSFIGDTAGARRAGIALATAFALCPEIMGDALFTPPKECVTLEEQVKHVEKTAHDVLALDMAEKKRERRRLKALRDLGR